MTTMHDRVNITTALTSWLKAFIEQNAEEYADTQKEYEECLTILLNELRDTVPQIADIPLLLEQKIASEALASFYLGLKANMDVCQNPIANDFLVRDFDTFLREERFHLLPAYQSAQETLDAIHHMIPKEYREKTTPIIEYESLMETYAPKIAHYCGFLYGNTFYVNVEPGYHPDWAYTHRYKNMIERYLQVKLPEEFDL
jgi:hypothetical protein